MISQFKRYLDLSTTVMIIIIGLASCEFKPSDIPLSPVEKPTGVPEISIALSPSMDTIRLSGPAWVTYMLETEGRKLYNVTMTLDKETDVDISYESDNKIKAYLNTNPLKDGIHSLEILIYTATNTGSIADKIGNEAYVYYLRWPVYINKAGKNNFIFYPPENFYGSLKLSWTKYLYADYDYYRFGWSNYFLQSGTTDIHDPKQNYFIDTTFVEGITKAYSILVYFSQGGSIHANLTLQENIPSPRVQINNDMTVDVFMPRSKYEKNIKEYCITTNVPVYGIDEGHDISDLNDTIVRLNNRIGFGGAYSVRLKYIPKGFESSHSYLDPTYGGRTTYVFGDSIPSFLQAFPISGEDYILLYRSWGFFKYNILTGVSSDYLQIAQSEYQNSGMGRCSPDGNILGYFENGKYNLRLATDYSLIKSFDAEAYNGTSLILNDIAISDNGLVSTVDRNKIFRIFDASLGQKVFEKVFEENVSRVFFSPDGSNLAIIVSDISTNTSHLVYYSFNGSQLTELGSTDIKERNEGEIIGYGPQAGNKFIISRWRSMYDYNVEIRDAHTFELLYYVELPGNFVPAGYEFDHDQVIARYQYYPSRNYSYLIDVKTGLKQKIVQFVGNDPVIFTKGIVFSGFGRSVEIDSIMLK